MSDDGEPAAGITDAVARAKRGTRSDVAALVDALRDGELHVPLARAVDDVPVGDPVPLPEELSLTPHVLAEEGGGLYCAVFTDPAILMPLERQLGWKTDGETLQYCTVPAVLALDMALQVMDEERVLGLVFNAMHATELVLDRREVGSIAKGKPLPLVGYVQHIAADTEASTLVAEPDSDPPRELVDAIEHLVRTIPEIESYELLSTFNAERDLEPHLTLRVRTCGSPSYEVLAQRIIAELEGKVPPPGYIDIVFDAALN